MKALRMFLTMAVIALLVYPTAIAGTEEAVLEVEGMTCGSCAHRIQSALEKLEGVHEARVELPLNKAFINHDPSQVSRAELVGAINALGYQASAKRDTTNDGKDAAPSPSGSAAAGASGANPSVPEKTVDAGALIDAQVATVADYIVQTIVAGGDNPNIAFTSEQIEEATGIVIPPQDEGRIQSAALAKLQEYPEALAAVASCSSRCSQYDACSLNGDLSGATGETLDMYAREKQEDGLAFDDQPLPAFEAMNTGLQRVRSQDLRGRPAVLVFLAGHCTHSMDTFPSLQEVTATYRVEGLQVVGVVVNSGTPDDVATWVSHFEPEYDVWVYENASLGDVIGSHLVPTYLFVDANGQVKEKLVGYKESEVVNEWLGRMLAEETRVSRR
jgi:copper chaperone CopZ/thiol-disulfide isomerase/thioredoxin